MRDHHDHTPREKHDIGHARMTSQMGDQTFGMPDAVRFAPPTEAQKKTKALRDGLKLARETVRVGSTWRHYKGGIYTITGHLFNANTQTFDARYKRVGGPDFEFHLEDPIEFGRPCSEWDETVYANSELDVEPINLANVLDPEQPCAISRFVKVQEVKRFETEGQIKERDHP